MADLELLVSRFRCAVEAARDAGSLSEDVTFRFFPQNCCGDTCYLLAEYLSHYGIRALYIWGDWGDQSHAWLVIDDTQIRKPVPHIAKRDPQLVKLLRQYGEDVEETYIEVPRYTFQDISNGLIIDITGDQFGEAPIYIGPIDPFHEQFVFHEAHECPGTVNHRQEYLYSIICEYLTD